MLHVRVEGTGNVQGLRNGPSDDFFKTGPMTNPSEDLRSGSFATLFYVLGFLLHREPT